MKNENSNIDQRSDLLSIYLRAFQGQIRALRGSARWKVGHAIISLIERILLRKHTSLSIDHMENMVEHLLNRTNINENIHPQYKTILTTPGHIKEASHEIGSVLFGVSNADLDTAIEGDVFTAYELAEACKKELGWHYELIDAKSEEYSKSEALISMLHDFDIRPLGFDGIQIAWVRGYAEYWIMKPWFLRFDIILCSSHKILNFITQVTDKPAYFFPIATNPDRIGAGQFSAKLECDVCFTGNRWKFERKIEKWLDSKKINGSIKIFGKGWDANQKLSPLSLGQISYKQIPDVYKSCKLVLDDSNETTFMWESVNSRVFDALGQDIPVLTNNSEGFRKLFHSDWPIFNCADELHQKANVLLSNSDFKTSIFEPIYSKVKRYHTYSIRAVQLNNILEYNFGIKIKFSIKIAATSAKDIEHWGDYYFAQSIKKVLTLLGHSVRIDIQPFWYQAGVEDEVVIVLRGLRNYKPEGQRINFLWIISHHTEVDAEELNAYDHVFVASKQATDTFREMTTTPVSTLLQATDTEKFYPVDASVFPSHKNLYVGNSRGVMREAISYALMNNIELQIYGNGWKDTVPAQWIQSEFIPNHLLKYYYSNANRVICDHWQEMKRDGFVSNRIFDALASGGRVVTDDVKGLKDVLDLNITTYTNNEEFADILTKIPEKLTPTEKRNQHLYILEKHSFQARVVRILDEVLKLRKFH